MSFTLRDDACMEAYEREQYCPCGVLLDGYTKPEDHEPTCDRHPDYRPDLDELDEADAMQTAMVRVPERNRVA